MTTPGRPGDATRAEPAVSWGRAVTALAVTGVLFLLGGVGCAVVWSAVADPPTYPAGLPTFDGSPVPDGQGLRRTFNVDATFFLVALTGSLLLGAGCATLFRRLGVVTVLAVLVGSGLGYLTMRHLGLGLGPEALVAQARDAGPGARLLGPLEVTATGVYFAWPIGALVGAMAALWAFAPRREAIAGGRPNSRPDSHPDSHPEGRTENAGDDPGVG